MNTSSRLPKNILYSFGLQIWMVAIQFFWIPFLMNSMGGEEYGLFTLFLTISWSFLFLDLGTRSALMKYIPELIARDKKDDVGVYTRVGVTIAGGAALLGALAVALLAPLFVFVILKIPAGLQLSAIAVFGVAAIGLWFNVLWNTLAAIPKGFRNFQIYFLVQAAAAGLSAVAVVWGIWMHFSVPMLATLYMLGSLGSCIGFYIVSRRLVSDFRIRPIWDKETAGKLLHIGGWITVGAVAGQLMFVLDRLILGHTQSLIDVGYYFVIVAIGARLPLLAQVVAQALLPTASGMVGGGAWDEFRDLFERSLRVVAVILIPVVVVTCVMGRTLFSLWLNSAFIQAAYWPLVLVMSGFLVNAVGVLYGVLSMVSGRLRAYATASVISMLLYLIVAWPLSRQFGMLGLSSAFLLSQCLVTGIWMIWLRREVLRSHLFLWFRRMERLLLLGLLIGVASYFVEAQHISHLLAAIFASLALILSSYLLSFFWVLDRTDRSKILGTLNTMMSWQTPQ